MSRHEDIVALLRDHARFLLSRLLELLDDLPPDLAAEAAIRQHFSTRGTVHADPPDHGRLRGLIGKAFSPRVIEAMRPRITAIVDRLLDAVAPRGEMDVIADLAYPLPAIIIAELLNIHLFFFSCGSRRRSRPVQALVGRDRRVPGHRARHPRGDPALRRRHQRHARLPRRAVRDARRRGLPPTTSGRPGRGRGRGRRLTTDELYLTCVTFLIGGHETTTSLIANGLFTLLGTRPRWPPCARTRPRSRAPSKRRCATRSPIQRAFRRVAVNTEFGGWQMRAGDIVIALLAAANRDPGTCPVPATFDIAREPNRHVAFGS
ncbi:MAG: hypothetical protein U0869_03860 [Chloroflexota bacterium]